MFLLQVVDHVLEFFRCGAVLEFLRGDEQAADLQLVGIGDGLGFAGNVQQRLGEVQLVDLWPALCGLKVGALLLVGDEQVGAAIALAFLDLLFAGRLFQGDHLRHPGRH
ncbi:hypothetical protein D3C80_1326750 [compost metagenome]